MAKYGHNGGVSIDATFGTNDKKVCSPLCNSPNVMLFYDSV